MKSNNFSRRNFIKTIGLGAAAVYLPGFNLFGDEKIPHIAIQLYTIRREIEKNFESAVQKISDIGYKGVETYALPENVSLERASKFYRKVGLKVCAMHVELPVGEHRETALRLAEAYDCDKVVYHGWPQGDKYSNIDAAKRTADLYNEIGDYLKTKGLQFGLHNHWWEFEKTEDFYPFYFLLDNLSPEIFFEIDTYWAKTGGQNPAKVLKDFGKRAPLLHIKDGPAIKGEKSYEQVPAGKGVMDFKSIAEAGKNNVECMIVEFDEFSGNIFDGVKDSYSYLTNNNFARGNV